MNILLTILKILGIILLWILGILLLLLLIILLAPINYSGKVSYVDTPEVHVKVGWLLFIRVPVDFVNMKLSYAAKVFGIKVYPRGKGGDKGDSDEEDAADEKAESVTSDEDESKAKKAESEKNGEKAETKKTEKSSEEVGKDKKDAGKADDKESLASDEEDSEEDTKPKEKLTDKLVRIAERLIGIWDNTEKALYDEEKKINLFFRRKTTKNSFEWLKKALFKLAKHILPRKLSGELEFGLDDPAVTGYITALASLFYDVYAENFELTPNFEEKIIKGKVEFKGHIILGYVAVIALRLYLRKQFRTFLKNAFALKDDTMENVEKIKDGIVNYG